jgi:glycosyltransferase involved in cell wall biosynthesis
MSKVSIIIPSCNEIATTNEGINVLQRTVQDVYEKATGEFEVLVGFNGKPYLDLPDYPNLKVARLPENAGIKTMINLLASMARGKYLYKSDAHCSFDKGFDEKLQYGMRDNWIVMPRFYVLDGKTWKWQDERFYDYFYLSCPFTDPRGFRFKAGGHWAERTKERLESHPEMDETPSIHGSGWFVNRNFFLNELGGFPNFDPMGHGQDSVYLPLKVWLGKWEGKVMVNKKTWYAHLHQSGNERGFHMSHQQTEFTYNETAKYWMKDSWAERTRNIAWLIEKFNMPTWPGNWRELLKDYQGGNYGL